MSPFNPNLGHLGLLLPLATSAANLIVALIQYPTFNAFLKTTDPTTTIAGRPFSRFWVAFKTPVVGLSGALLVTTGAAGIVTSRWLASLSTQHATDASQLYFVGALLTVAHLATAPLVLGPVGRITGRATEVSGSKEGEVAQANKEDMARYYTVHHLRTALFDVPAVICFAQGVALNLKL